MKAIIRFPTEQYAYIELDCEVANTEEAVQLHNQLSKSYKGEFGLTDKEFNIALDKYMTDGETLSSEEYLKMNNEQKNVMQQVKKAIKRLKYKEHEIQ